MPITDYWASILVNAAASAYLALYTEAPEDDAGSGTEVLGGSYARQPATLVPQATNPKIAENSAAIVFTNMPDCEVVAVALLDADTAGNMLYYQTITPRIFAAGDSGTIAAGTLTLPFDAL